MKKRRWLITVAACLLVFASLAVYKINQIRAAIAFGESFPEPSETVEAVRTESYWVNSNVTTLGEIVAPQMVALRNEIEGRIVEINFEAGAIVKSGQVLLQLDVSEETARLQSALASAELARLDLQRIEQLRERKTVSQEQLDQARAQFNVANADIQALQAAIEKKTLRAPFDAYAGLHTFSVGELLENNTLITSLVGINDYVWVDFNLPHQKANVEIGTQVQVTLAGPQNLIVPASIIAKDSVLSAESRNLRFRARLQSPQTIAPNTVVNVTIPIGVAHSATSVPATAIRHDGLGDYVYVLEVDTNDSIRAHRRVVTLGQPVVNSAEQHIVSIMSGLKQGELVAANGAFKLRDGILVFIKEQQTVAETNE